MGINDRDYYRDEEPEVFQRATASMRVTKSSDALVKSLIAINIAVYVVNSILSGDGTGFSLNGLLSLHLAGLKNFELWRLVTYGFCHASLNHLIFNMFGLWMFGRLVESVRGARETLAFYLLALVVSGASQIFIGSGSKLAFQVVVGASGGCCALTVLSAFYFSRLKLHSLIFPFGIELRWAALIYVGIDAMGVLRGGGDHIAYWAHLGGAAFGALYGVLGMRLTPTRSLVNWSSVTTEPASTVPWREPEAPARSAQQAKVRLYEPPVDALDNEVDRLLDKINREGKASLSPAELEVLNRASQVYQQRR